MAQLRIFQAFILGVPLWWMLGVDFIMPHLLAASLMIATLTPHLRFRFSDWLIVGVILALSLSAYLVGFLVRNESLRVIAALYNASIWACGLIVLQQLRHMLLTDSEAERVILRTLVWSFGIIVLFAWTSVTVALATRSFNLATPTLFGLMFGDALPRSVKLLQDSANIMFTQEDWGLRGAPAPRVAVFSPYPTAAAALFAVVGSLALLSLQRQGRTLLVVFGEIVLTLTLALTLTRTVLAGWVFGMIVANLIFGSAIRKLAGLAGAVVLPILIVSWSPGVGEYRQYSTETRFANYIRAINVTLRINPVIGLGVKPREISVSADDRTGQIPIPLGSHSTWVSSFTRGGALALGFVVAYLLLLPLFRWLVVLSDSDRSRSDAAGLRILCTLQMVLWIWLFFEDLDAPASTAMHVFIAFAFIEAGLGQQARGKRHGRNRSVAPFTHEAQGFEIAR